MKAALIGLTMPSGVPIKRVRLLKPEKTIQPLGSGEGRSQAFVKPGSTHHLWTFEVQNGNTTTKDAVFVTTLEAAKRIRDEIPIIQRIHPNNPDAKFLMSLSSRELILREFDGEQSLVVYKSAKATTKQMEFVSQYDARASSQQRKLTCYPSTFEGHKVTVDPLGRIRRAGD